MRGWKIHNARGQWIGVTAVFDDDVSSDDVLVALDEEINAEYFIAPACSGVCDDCAFEDETQCKG